MAVLTVKTRNSLGVMHPGAQHKKRPHLHRRSLFHRNVDGKRGQQKGPLGVYNGPKENLNVCSLARNSTCSWFAQFRRNQEIAPLLFLITITYLVGRWVQALPEISVRQGSSSLQDSKITGMY